MHAASFRPHSCRSPKNPGARNDTLILACLACPHSFPGLRSFVVIIPPSGAARDFPCPLHFPFPASLFSSYCRVATFFTVRHLSPSSRPLFSLRDRAMQWPKTSSFATGNFPFFSTFFPLSAVTLPSTSALRYLLFILLVYPRRELLAAIFIFCRQRLSLRFDSLRIVASSFETFVRVLEYFSWLIHL